MIRRLTVADTDLLRAAYAWDTDRPMWYRQADAVFNSGTDDNLIQQLTEPANVFVGLFDPDLSAVVIIEWRGDGLFEGHLMAKRGANVELIAATIQQLIHDLLDFGMTEACCWVAERNIGIRRMCVNIGFQPDGVAMWRGSYRSRAIKWVRYFIQREQVDAMTQAA